MAQTQLGVRGQNMGLQTAAAGIPNSSQTWGSTLGSIGGALMGAGGTGMAMGGMGGGAGAGSMTASVPMSSSRNPGYSGGGSIWDASMYGGMGPS